MDWDGISEFKVPLNQEWVHHAVSFGVAQSGQKVSQNWMWAPGETLWFWLKEQETGLLMLKEREFSCFLFIFWLDDSKGNPGSQKVRGTLKRGKSLGKWPDKVVYKSLGSPLCKWQRVNLTLNSIPKDLRWTINWAGPPPTTHTGHQVAHVQEGSEKQCKDWK